MPGVKPLAPRNWRLNKPLAKSGIVLRHVATKDKPTFQPKATTLAKRKARITLAPIGIPKP